MSMVRCHFVIGIPPNEKRPAPGSSPVQAFGRCFNLRVQLLAPTVKRCDAVKVQDLFIRSMCASFQKTVRFLAPNSELRMAPLSTKH